MTDETSENAKGILEERVAKLARIRAAGLNPYPHYYELTHRVPKLVLDKQENVQVRVAGRITGVRKMGKATFLDIVDRQQKIQVYFKEGVTSNYLQLDLLDLGDFIGVEGGTFLTRTGEYSIRADGFDVLCKSLRPSMNKDYGVSDPEQRYSDRTLDLLANSGVQDTFLKRAKSITAMRHYLDREGFVEVEIPLIQPVYGGASAAPFITRVNSLNRDYFLSISPEIYLKRLIAGGMDAVYTITKNFRNEGIDSSHNPEFTSMECYRAYNDYNDMMRLTENMLASIAQAVNGSTQVQYGELVLNFEPPWERMPMAYAIEKFGRVNFDGSSDSSLRELLNKTPSVNLGTGDSRTRTLVIDSMTRGDMMLTLFEHYAEPHLDGPVFITDHPIESTPLCKPHRTKPGLIERFEAYIGGMELANAYTELNDPHLQRRLFEEQLAREGPNNRYLKTDEAFMRALEYGMPPTGGLGIGVDRLVMLLANQRSIKEVILFPMTRAEIK